MKTSILLIFTVLTSISFAGKSSGKDKPTVLGLKCEKRSDGREQILKLTITVKKEKANILIQTDTYRPIAQVSVPAKSVAPILADKLAEMNGKTIVDTDKRVTMAFRTSGADYKGLPYLAIIITSPDDDKLNMKLQSCVTDYNYKFRAY